MKDLSAREVKCLNSIVDANAGRPQSLVRFPVRETEIASILYKAGLLRIASPGMIPESSSPSSVIINTIETLRLTINILCRNELLYRDALARSRETWEPPPFEDSLLKLQGKQSFDFKIETDYIVTELAKSFVRSCREPSRT
jgi:hypothetical protein